MSKVIYTANGTAVLVDDADYERLRNYHWTLKKGYAVRNINTPKGERKWGMAYDVLGVEPQEGMQIDHKDNNPLNNQRDNLRFVPARVNSQNKSAYGTIKYRGVSVNKRNKNPFRGTMTQSTQTAEQSALWRDITYFWWYGEEARPTLNFPEKFVGVTQDRESLLPLMRETGVAL